MTSVARSVVTCQADADVSLPSPRLRLFLSLSSLLFCLSLPLSSFYTLRSLSLPPFDYLSLSLSITLNATRGRNPIRATLSLPHSSSRNIPSRLNPCDCPPPSFLARALAGIFSPPPHPSRVRFLFVIVLASILNSLVFSRSFQQRCQWRDQPFFREQTPLSIR